MAVAKRLQKYRAKRDFAGTPEPLPRLAANDRHSFVVQLHHARRRHFDFRLELGGTLRSWAVPKGPSLDPAEKRLAVEVEDHPLDYASFEGDIPEGHYGAGHVDLWDRGDWRADGDPEAGIAKGHLGFELFGTRLKGHWDLIRTRYSGRQPNWLLVKRDDDYAQAGDVADDTPLSQRSAPAPPPRAKAAPKARMTPMPTRIGLQLARVEARAPAGTDWLHEVKYDGYRALLSRSGKTVKVTSRNGLDWTPQLPALAKALRALPCRACVLDSELVIIDEHGRSRFDLLQARFADARENDLRAVAFDLLFVDGRDLRGEPQSARKAALAALLDGAPAPLHLADYLEGDGPAAAEAACRAGLEGIISKARDAPYEEGRGGAWLKIKCVDSGEFAVVGYTPGKGARAKLGALLLAEPGAAKAAPWAYVGRVGSGLTEAHIALLLKKLKPLATAPPLAAPPTRADLHGVAPVWVKPGVVVEVEHRGWTGERRLRQGSLKGLRIDRTVQSLRAPDAPPRVAPVASGRKATSAVKASQARNARNARNAHNARNASNASNAGNAGNAGNASNAVKTISPDLRHSRESGNPAATARRLAKLVARPPAPLDSRVRGNDDVNGSRGNDDVNGSRGNDDVNGSRGNDDVNGSRGNDDVNGSRGNDDVSGSGGNDEVSGTRRNDKARAGRGNGAKNAGRQPGAAAYPFTHPERLLFATPPITKRALGDYYARVAPLLLPELVHRPLSLIRCPDGADGTCFFQKHSSPGFRDAIRETPIAGNKGDVQNYLYVEDLEGLLDLVQMNVIELHPWGSRIATLEQPDRLVFDLDPAPEVAWKRVVAAAELLRERLAALKLVSFVRTSGGKGLHVVVPLTPSADWDTAKAFTQAMAQTLAAEAPEEFVATVSKARREGRIFIDYLRNGRGATSVASYSLRARAGAPAATPLRWDELPRLKSGAQYGFANMGRRLATLSGEDPWAGIERVRQQLPGTPAAARVRKRT